MHVYTIEQMRELERAADAAGHSYEAMMEAAGLAVARVVEAWWERGPGGRVLLLAGPGNNGGDGLVAARELARMGYSVVACLWQRPAADPLVSQAREQGVRIVRAESEADRLYFQRALERAELVIDALFGTGLSRPIQGRAAEMLAALRARRGQPADPAVQWLQRPPPPAAMPAVVAVDVPSGLHGDSGEVDPATAGADLTVTFAGTKWGMVQEGASRVLGELIVAGIGIPAEVTEAAERVAELLSPAGVAALLPERPAGGHKGTFGTTLIVGGSINYVGAPALSALAAGYSGAGLVSLGVPTVVQPLLAARPDLTTATWHLLPHDMGVLCPDAAAVLREPLERADALVLGPGLGGDESARRFVWRLLGVEQAEARQGSIGFVRRDAPDEQAVLPLPATVVDADGLNALAAWEGAWWEKVETPLVLTPHPGEMGRLLARDTSTVQEKRLASAQEAAARWGQVVVLKGAFTVVAAPDGRASIAPYANDALAKAGAGDILAGMIGALLGQGIAPYDAARIAVVAHGLAGEELRRCTGAQGALASDLLAHLPAVWQALRRNRGGPAA